MNREIKFRGLTENADDTKEFAYGYLSMCEGKFTIGDSEGVGTLVCDENSIGQYTGLKDKNGKEIYEGDILQAHGNKVDLSKVVYGEFPVIDVDTLTATDNVIGWHYEVIPTNALSKCEPFNKAMPLTDFYISRCEFEVIGNIYENHELLEGGATE